MSWRHGYPPKLPGQPPGKYRLVDSALPLLHGSSALYALADDHGSAVLSETPDLPARTVVGWVPELFPERLGDSSFLSTHGVRYPYAAGAMAGGIGSVELVVAMAQAGMLAGFGTGGLSLERIERAILGVRKDLGGAQNYEFNLLYDPLSPQRELATANLYLQHEVRRISASGYMALTLPLVLYRARGLSRAADGQLVAENHILAKLSRPEVAREFMSPAPGALLEHLVATGELTKFQAELAAQIPMAEDITVEADSGGHTDNQALIPLLSSTCDLRDEIVHARGYARPVRVGAAGGIATPATVAAAFAAGAQYVVTGSINQSCREAGTCDLVKQMLCQVDIGGVDMAPAADLFEMGGRVQVLKHRTLFAPRAKKLLEVYRAHGSWEEISEKERKQLEERFFRRSFAEVWHEVEQYLRESDPGRLEAAHHNPKQRLGMAFKWYLHMAWIWAIEGTVERAVDFQVWCGPAMAAFNRWAQGSFLQGPEERRVAVVAMNLLHGAAALLRARFLALQGICLPPSAFQFRPRRFDGAH